jgi:large conductance mechanosensitive channel
MPPIGLLLGKVDFRGLFIDLSGQGFKTLEAAKAANAPTINYGVFINTIINFVIIAFALFLLVRTVNQWTAKPAPPAAPTEKECPFCFSKIPIKATRCPHCTSQL